MKQEITNLLKEILKKRGIKRKDNQILDLIEIPPTLDKGDYAFPCFSFATELKSNPHQIALELRQEIGNPPEGFGDIQIVGGYLNFFVDRRLLAKTTIDSIFSLKEKYGSTNIGKRRKALIEHTSINPNASPHVGRARNAILGDSLVRIFKFLNYQTEVHYYVNDVSKQIAMLVLAGAKDIRFNDMLKKYISISAKVKKSKELEKEVFDLLFEFEHGATKTVEAFKKVTETCVEGQAKILESLGIKYDVFDYESKYLKDSSKILKQLHKLKKLKKDEDGRWVMKLKGTPLEKKMRAPYLVLTRSDGTGLYPLRDIAYTLDKKRQAKKNLIVLGEDQKLYFEEITQALKFLGKDAPEVVHYSFVLLSEKGKTKKMATRKGDVILLEDFLADAIKKAERNIKKRGTEGNPRKVGVGAVRYAILKNGNNKIINFNLEEALSFEGDTGPYLQYTYARASSIIRKSKITEKKLLNYQVPEELDSKEEALVKKISSLEEIVIKAYNTLNPSVIANYSYQLAQIFNEFYHACPVISKDKNKMSFRLALVASFRQALANSMNLLGIHTMEEM